MFIHNKPLLYVLLQCQILKCQKNYRVKRFFLKTCLLCHFVPAVTLLCLINVVENYILQGLSINKIFLTLGPPLHHTAFKMLSGGNSDIFLKTCLLFVPAVTLLCVIKFVENYFLQGLSINSIFIIFGTPTGLQFDL